MRRAFLKSDVTEAGHVVEMFSRIALAHPEIHLTYRSGGKIIHDLPPAPGTRERIAVFFGRELAESLLWVEGRLDEMHLWGYAAHPSQSRSTPKGQYLFLGGRYVRDRSLSHALNEAYRGLLMVGRMPVAFLHLDLPPEEVDINVHPTKVEVRFRDSQPDLQSSAGDPPPDLLEERPARAATSGTGAGCRSRGADPPRPAPRWPAAPRPEPGKSVGTGSSLGRLDLAGGPADRQTVASWFEPSKPRPQIPDSVGQPVPRVVGSILAHRVRGRAG